MFAHLNKLKFTPIFITSVISIMVFAGISFADTLENRYEPYPIIFVHGYNNMPERVSEEDLWKLALEKFEPFFSTDTDTKYFSNFKYCQIIDYRAKSNGDIEIIADDLKDRIDYVLDAVLTGRKEEEKKVIIVAHSMGGLVTRRLLEKYSSYQNKIERVVFIGTPHLGSPLATGIVLTDRMIPELQQALAQNDKYSMPDMNPILCWQSLAYGDRYNKIASALVLFNQVVNWDIKVSPKEMLAGDLTKKLGLGGRYDRKAPHNFGQGVAVGELVVPTTVTASKTFIGKASILTTFPFSGITIAETEPLTTTSGYVTLETYLNSNARALPNKIRLIKGTGSLGAWLMGKTGGSLLKSLASYSGLPPDNNFDDLESGDGIVTPLSQTEPLCEPEDIYTVDRCHLTETNAWEAILKAIDDPPKIERVYAVPCDWTGRDPNHYYVIIKVKEYLLADIEIESITFNGTSVNLAEFDDGNGHYKPYVKFDRAFLKERNDDINVKDSNGNNIALEPGEFYVQVNIPYYPYGQPNAYPLNIKLKNPSGKTKEEIISISRATGYAYFTDCYWYYAGAVIDVPPYRPPIPNEGDVPRQASVTLNIYDKYSSNMYVEAGMCNEGAYIPFKVLHNASVSLGDQGNYYKANINNYTIWDGSNGSGGTVAEDYDYELKINILPENRYAVAANGYKMSVPFFYWDIIRTDPTFIQQHRSYGYLAKFNKVKRFERYGYKIRIYKLNPNQEPMDLAAEPSDNNLIAYEFLVFSYLSKEYSLKLNNINNVISEKIENAMSQVIEIEDNYYIEKERLTNQAYAELNNKNYSQILKENKVSVEVISQLEEKNNQMINQKTICTLNELVATKDTSVKSIIKNTNNSIQALINTAYPHTTASAALVK